MTQPLRPARSTASSYLAIAFCLAALPAVAAPSALEVQFEGEAKGTASLSAAKGGVFFRVTLEGLPPASWVAFHVHENPACDHAAGHEAAGGHFNPAGTEHGWLSARGPHAGDLPNLRVDAEGRAEAEFVANLLTFEPGEASVQGRALIVHEKPDDYKTQPSGDAGRRLACAVIPAP